MSKIRKIWHQIALKFKQYFCEHDFEFITNHTETQQKFWQCKKCSTYYIHHYDIGVGWKCRKLSFMPSCESKEIPSEDEPKGFTKEEAKAYEASLFKLFWPTGVNLDDFHDKDGVK